MSVSHTKELAGKSILHAKATMNVYFSFLLRQLLSTFNSPIKRLHFSIPQQCRFLTRSRPATTTKNKKRNKLEQSSLHSLRNRANCSTPTRNFQENNAPTRQCVEGAEKSCHEQSATRKGHPYVVTNDGPVEIDQTLNKRR